MIISKGLFTAKLEAEHRDAEGNLIARSVSIQAQSPPQCARFRCVWKFFLQVILCGLLSTYHRKRFLYAEKKRYKIIPMEYRTGENSPENIRQTIWGIIKFSLRR